MTSRVYGRSSPFPSSTFIADASPTEAGVVSAQSFRQFDHARGYPSVALAQRANVDPSEDHLVTWGYSATGDGGGGLYKRVSSEPSHPGKIQSADGAWWELVPEGRGYNAAAFGPTDAASYQAILDGLSEGDTLFNPDGWQVDLDDGLTIDTPIKLTGRGLMNFTAGIAGKAAIQVNASGTVLEGLYLYNPNALQNTAQGSARPYGVEIRAHDVVVRGCRVRQFQNAIAQRADGEWYRARVHDNWCEDCLGAGGGQASSSADGEDRGDGITIWGAGSTVMGNVIQLKAGQDGRVGLHAERLSASIVTTGDYDNSLVAFTGNVVEGAWRRGIVFEGMTGAVALGNVVYGSTWWLFCLQTGCQGCTMSDNKGVWDKANTSWGSWSPTLAPIKIYNEGANNTVRNNYVHMLAGSACAIGISLQTADAVQKDCLIEGNTIEAEDATVTFSTSLARLQETGGVAPLRPVFRNNRLIGDAPEGLQIEAIDEPVIEGNVIQSLAASPVSGAAGIQVNSASCNYPYIRRNTSTGWDDGIFLASMTAGGVCDDNRLEDCADGIHVGSSIAEVYIRGNRFDAITGNRIANVPTSMRAWVYDNEGQRLFLESSYDAPSIAAGAAQTQTFTVTGAALGDIVEVSSEASLAGLIMTADVSAADTVTLTLFNPTGGAVNLSARDYRFVVRKIGGFS